MSKFVVATLASPTLYTGWVKNNGVNMVEKQVLVQGGAGVARGGGAQVITPKGIQTEVSDEDAAWLKDHPHFVAHRKGGFVEIHDRSQVPDRRAEGMATDASGPKTDKDVAAENRKTASKDGDAPALSTSTGKVKAA